MKKEITTLGPGPLQRGDLVLFDGLFAIVLNPNEPLLFLSSGLAIIPENHEEIVRIPFGDQARTEAPANFDEILSHKA